MTAPHPAPSRPAPPTVEESRLGTPAVPGGAPVAQQVLTASGFDRFPAAFEAALHSAASLPELLAVVRGHGAALWDAAVARAREPEPAGSLDRFDDRPLYWARTAMSAALRTLDSEHLAVQHQRFTLLHVLDRTSRGIDRPLWPTAAPGDLRVAVSGFDVYQLDADVRHSNPSGAAALQLDGARFEFPQGTAVVRAVVLPVNYGDFDQGVVEDAFGPVLRPGPQRADLITTISMTARGRMDVEKWAAGARGGTPDNNRDQHFGPVARAARWPQPEPSPEWIETTLPHEAMVAAGTAPWPVVLRDGVREWPAGTFPDPAALRSVDDPTAGSTPAAGTGGDYLSNESMYRSNRLRQAFGAHDVPGGHLHVSALLDPADLAALTDEAFAADRRAVVEQTVALVRAAARAVLERRA
ncbi:hypothetical protein [Kineococcus rhizosphaerae]|uniref:Pyrrolidone-carboxylate peptidase n=1 Tax=Kineococcus rhizosphaerae TaxID=559628 RepID=A0A2T0R6N4_9ACTN|nr:hypothetical protein [Kineococcus rhizosphaerae]PRY16835.1 hypothetical protein CLV37_103267 [Kineococcus rhizosphaerae]